MTLLPRSALPAALLLPITSQVLASAAAPREPVTPGLGDALEMLLSLALVLTAIFALAWLLRRVKSLPLRRSPLLSTEAELAVGDREKIVILVCGAERLLLGVTAGGISVLQRLPEAPMAATPAEVPAASSDFRSVLRRSLGLAK